KNLIVLALFLSASLLAASELSLQDIPEIPGSTLTYSHYFGKERLVAEYWIFLPDQVSFQARLERGRAEAERCLDLMKGKGWVLEKENRSRRGGEFLFKKDVIKVANVTIGPRSKSLAGRKKDYIIFKFEMKRLIPFTDVLGYDFPDVPRFPGSTRIRWMNLLGDYSVKYLVTGKADEVKKFFKKKLPEYDWEPAKGAGTLNYTKGGYTSTDSKTAPVDKKDIKKPIEMAKKMIPTTLSIHLSEDEGIVNIGIGRSAGSADSIKKALPPITPPEIAKPETSKPLTFINHEKDIPLYPGLTRKQSEKLPIDLKGNEIIRLPLAMTQVEQKIALQMAAFYLEEMKKRGWDLTDDEWYGLGRTMLFQKGAVNVKIKVKAIGRYPIPEGAKKINIPVEIDVILPLPLRDIAGKDIKGVPRFPGSVRFYYLKVALDHTVKYKAAASVKEVEWFYIRKLPDHGWTFSGYDKTGLLFVPSSTAKSAADALAKGKLIPTTLKLKVDDHWDGTVKIGLTRTKGD
ncbi:MAG: hypothetical protein GTN53_24895, partial [Candidatus Aminicenantes bacterium]|nr:hypothetical protein [Candidatus Aminicenantes bacterium]NIQ69730.1 hypothetical protein [Candidatus Aminicenantes bacterium]NIT25746.1 hypothetical protein [Candidatus Aminicenantes bacterium]